MSVTKRFYLPGLFFLLQLLPQLAFTQAGLLDILEPFDDSSMVYYFYPLSPEELTPDDDTTLLNVHQYDPLRRRRVDYINLGNPGTAHQPILFQPPYRKGFDVGFHQFDLYKIRMRFHKLQKAYTNIYYAQGGRQDDALLNVRFGRNFGKNIHFSIEYNRLIQAGVSSDKYRNLQAKNPTFATGFWIKSKNQRYNGFIHFQSNIMNLRDNGGITDPNIFGADEFQSAISIPVFLQTASTRHSEQELSYTQHLDLSFKKDTSATKKQPPFRLTHQFNFRTGFYKFTDPNSAQNANFYGDFQVDSRGLRHFISTRSLENLALIQFTQPVQQDSGATTITSPNIIQAGLSYKNIWLNQEPVETYQQQLFVQGDIKYTVFKRFSLEANGHFGILDYAGDYRLHGQLGIDLKKLGNVSVALTNQNYSPTVLENRLFVSRQLVWENDFRKTLATTLAGHYELPTFQLKLSGYYHLLNSFIYYDQTGRPAQEDGAISLFQFVLEKDFRLWKFHLDNTAVFQASTDDVIRFPQFFLKHSVYFEGTFFKKALLSKIGVDLRIADSYFPNAYQPLTGQFFLQDETEVELFPTADIFISFKIKTFRLFFKIENATRWFTDDVYYQTPLYPVLDSYFRFGLNWQLWN